MTSLEKHYNKKKLELTDQAELAVIESNIREGLVKDYIIALIIQEQDRLREQGEAIGN